MSSLPAPSLSTTHMEPDVMIPRATLSTHLRLLFQDLDRTQYPCIRYLPTELINLITDYSMTEGSSMTVTFVDLFRSGGFYGPKLTSSSNIRSNEDEIRRRCLQGMMDHLHVVSSTSFQTIVADHYDTALEDSDVLQAEAAHLPPELVFPSDKQRSAYLLFECYKRVLLAGKDPDVELPKTDSNSFHYCELALYSIILFGDIHEALNGFQHFRFSKDKKNPHDYCGFLMVSSEIDSAGRLETRTISGKLNEKELVLNYPNPFTPNLTMPRFFNQLIQQEKPFQHENRLSKSPAAANSDGEAEYDPTKPKSKSSSRKSRKHSRLDSDEDPSEEEEDEWNPDEEEAELLKAEEDALEENDEEYVPIKKKKTANKRRKIVSDDEEEYSPKVEEDEFIPPADQDGDDGDDE